MWKNFAFYEDVVIKRKLNADGTISIITNDHKLLITEVVAR